MYEVKSNEECAQTPSLGHPVRAEISRVREHAQVIFEGVTLTVLDRPLRDGDTYLAGRNTGPHLLTARKVDHDNGWVVSEEGAYPFDIHECVPVEIVID